MEKFDRVSDSHTKLLARQLDFSSTAAAVATAKTTAPVLQARIQSHSGANSRPPPDDQGEEDSHPRPAASEIAGELLRLELMSQKPPCSLASPPPQEVAMVPGKYKTGPHDVTPPQKSPLHRMGQRVQRNSLVKNQSSKQELSTSLLNQEIESMEVTPKKPKHCSCKNSKCLKLYCECFACGSYCNGCNCLNCHNNLENEAARQEAIGIVLDRNPHAFKPKIAGSPLGTQDSQDVEHKIHILGKHNKGCNCKKSGCLKKYCECYQANVLCSEICRCQDCKNFEGSEERTALIHGPQSSVTYIKQAANAAISGAVGLSGFLNTVESRKRKSEEVHHAVQYQQGNHFPSNGATSLVSPPDNMMVSVSRKRTYRSSLADAIQPRHVKELCSLLVSVSMDVTKKISGGNCEADKIIEKDGMKPFPDMGNRDASPDTVIDGHRGGDQTATKSGDSVSDQPDTEDERPLSPATRALMCDEDCIILSEEVTEARLTTTEEKQESSTTNQDSESSELYAEQERHVLLNFRDFLARLVTYGSIKEKMTSTLARCERRSKDLVKSEAATNLSTKKPEDHKQSHRNTAA